MSEYLAFFKHAVLKNKDEILIWIFAHLKSIQNIFIWLKFKLFL